MIKLYHGTTERVAKTAPMTGIQPYRVPHNDSEITFSDPEKGTIRLTSLYAGLQAFSAAQEDGRWGIVEVRWQSLEKNLVADSDLMKGRGRKTWRESIDTVGMCVLRGCIPPQAIGRVIIFDPRSNWVIARTVLHLSLGSAKLKQQQHQLTMLHRWLTGDFFFIEDWLGPELNKFSKQERDKMADVLNNRSGLDIFHHGSGE